MRILLVATLLLVVCISQSQGIRVNRDGPHVGDNPWWVPLNWTTIPPAQSGDLVDVFYLVAPLLEDDVGPILGELNLFHGAVAFRNQRTNYTITINYDALDFFRASLFPDIKKDPNGTKTLDWYNQGALFIYSEIYTAYWTKLLQKVGTVEGPLFNTYIVDYVAKMNQSEPFYNMFGVLPSFGADVWVDSWECFDFCWGTWGYLIDRGAKFDITVLKRDYTNLYSFQPPLKVTELYYIDQATHKEIVDFYEFIALKVEALGVWGVILELLDAFEGKFYLRQSDDYWKFQIKFPYLGMDWWDCPLQSPTLNP